MVTGEEVEVDRNPEHLGLSWVPVLGLPEVVGVEDGVGDEAVPLEYRAMTRRIVLMSRTNSKVLGMVCGSLDQALVAPLVVLDE